MGHGKDREVNTCAGPVGCVVSDGSATSYSLVMTEGECISLPFLF